MYEGRWGRRVYGRIQRGPKYTRFHLEMTMHNDLVIQRDVIVPNCDMEVSGVYKFTLDTMTREIEAQYQRKIYTS